MSVTSLLDPTGLIRAGVSQANKVLDTIVPGTNDGAGEYGPTPQSHEYKTVTGLLTIPRAVGAPKVVRIHAEYGLRIAKWEYHRNQRPPVIPKADDILVNGVANDTYMGGSVTAGLPRWDPLAGGYNFSIKGEYIYTQTVQRDAGDARQLKNRKPGVDPLPTGKYPYSLQLQTAQMLGVLGGGIPITSAITAMADIGRAVVDTNSLYSFPFTFFPSQASDTTLFS